MKKNKPNQTQFTRPTLASHVEISVDPVILSKNPVNPVKTRISQNKPNFSRSWSRIKDYEKNKPKTKPLFVKKRSRKSKQFESKARKNGKLIINNHLPRINRKPLTR